MRPLILLTLAAAAAGTARAQTAAPAASTAAPVVNAIRVEQANVFDPAVKGEDIWPFRIADKIHFLTKEHVLRQELLLAPGDRYDALKALESERNIRSLGIFRRADITPEPRPDGKVDLALRAQDSWTTNVRLGAGTEGGDNYFFYGFSEANLLGYGKAVNFQHSQVGPRVANDYSYNDPRFLGSRFSLNPYYTRSNQGDSLGTELIRPFFSLDSSHAMDLGWARSIGEALLYRDADTYSKFQEHASVVTTSYGRRLENDAYFVQRVEAGWYVQKDEFNPTVDTVAGTLPANRTLSGPTVGYSWVQPRYVKETYVDRMERVEDYNMGNELRVFGGYTGPGLGGDRDRVLFNAADQQGLRVAPGRFALSAVGVTGRVSRGVFENAVVYTNFNLFWKTYWPYPQTWVAHLEANRGRNLDGENQIILGGNTGLRGYRNYSFAGGKSVLLNLENRFFFPGEYFHLVRFGGVAFFDSGAVAPEPTGLQFRHFNSDVGFGFRFSPTRSQSGTVVRMDLAYALERGPAGSRFVVSIRGGQAFQIFNSSTGRARQTPGSKL